MYNYFDCPVYDSDEYRYNQYLGNHINKQNKGSRGRDTERTKTYSAEWAFQRKIEDIEFGTIEEAKNYAKRIYKSKTWRKLWMESVEEDVLSLVRSQPKIVEMQRKSTLFSGKTDGFTVVLNSDGGFNRYTLIHELTHCLGHMHHGRSFRRTLLKLVGTFMGTKERDILKSQFKRRKLSVGKSRNPLTFDSWMESRKRMEKLREEKEFRAECLAMHEKLEKRRLRKLKTA